MPGLDPRLAKRFQHLEKENQTLKGEVNALKGMQNNQGGNAVQRGIRSMLRMSTIGKIANPHLYLPKKNNPTSQGVSSNLSAERLFGKPKKMRLF